MYSIRKTKPRWNYRDLRSCSVSVSPSGFGLAAQNQAAVVAGTGLTAGAGVVSAPAAGTKADLRFCSAAHAAGVRVCISVGDVDGRRRMTSAR